VTSALEVFKADLWAIITVAHYQWVIAIGSLVLGSVALYDGKHFFKLLVSICVGASAFTVVLSQLRPNWTGEIAYWAKYVASLEVGALIGWSAYSGWNGTQLLLGLTLGMCLFHNLQAVAQTIPYIDIAAQHSIWIITVSTLMVAIGVWGMDAKRGAGRVLGILCPVFGGSLVVATCGYLTMLACTLPAAEKVLHMTVSPSDVPSVFEFWYMIACPMNSQAVGFFKFTNRYMNISAPSGTLIKLEVDRTLGIFFWVIISAVAIWCQLKADRLEREKMSSELKVRLLSGSNNKVEPGAPPIYTLGPDGKVPSNAV